MITEKSVFMSEDKSVKIRYEIKVQGGDVNVVTTTSLRNPQATLADIRAALDAAERDISNKIAGLNMLPSKETE